MCGTNADPDCQLADRQIACAVHAAGIDDGEFGEGLLEDALSFGFSQSRLGLVIQATDSAAVVMVTNPALETCVCACAVALQLRV